MVINDKNDARIIYQKLKKVVLSCETRKQLDVTLDWVHILIRQNKSIKYSSELHSIINLNFNYILGLIKTRLLYV